MWSQKDTSRFIINIAITGSALCSCQVDDIDLNRLVREAELPQAIRSLNVCRGESIKGQKCYIL